MMMSRKNFLQHVGLFRMIFLALNDEALYRDANGWMKQLMGSDERASLNYGV